MPQIMIRGMELNDIKRISKPLVDELSEVIGCPRDYFTIEQIHSTFIADGEITKAYPFIQVNWFDRGQEIQDKAAKVIDSYVRDAGYEQVEVYFIVLNEEKYYENGEHY
ncbi:DUF1904 domain-containing protein [Heliobacterium chlorum]|uniref:DUF1904 domain-containing protein n=1 Tax=Heliobacterium chlorum TaxID=2698 RepID=A0ABR7T0D1_HELCL|nr:DUF1904 domain-containing protein [Heliobacterium chlorum]MBC9784247.1 DUF1904 domain-containing protein [Heliobacterium chlorum]